MGTRALTIVHGGDEEIVVMYCQFDGYVGGHGHDLAKFLESGTLVNGIGMQEGRLFNGMGCLAAQMVAHFKEGPGGFYLHPSGTRNAGEEYRYHVRYIGDEYSPGDGYLEVQVFAGWKDMKEIFKGSAADLLNFTEEDEE